MLLTLRRNAGLERTALLDRAGFITPLLIVLLVYSVFMLYELCLPVRRQKREMLGADASLESDGRLLIRGSDVNYWTNGAEKITSPARFQWPNCDPSPYAHWLSVFVTPDFFQDARRAKKKIVRVEPTPERISWCF